MIPPFDPDDLPPPTDEDMDALDAVRAASVAATPGLMPPGAQAPAPRVLNVSPEQYHKLPGLSPSIAGVMHSRCPAVARDQYERELEAAASEQESDDDDAAEPEARREVAAEKQKRLDRGSILHALVLGIGKRIEVIPSHVLGKGGKYSTSLSKERRDAARQAGRLPVKEQDMEMHRRCADAIRARLAAAGHVLDGVSELAIEWWEPSAHGAVQCRTMMDHVALVAADGLAAAVPPEPPVHIRPTSAFIYELKFPDDACPDRSERTANQLGYEIAAAARLRALNALFPSLAGRIEYRYLICEPHRPYVFWAPTPTGAFLGLGNRRWTAAVRIWGAGIATGRWTGYHDDVMRQQIDLLRWVKLQEGFTDDE